MENKTLVAVLATALVFVVLISGGILGVGFYAYTHCIYPPCAPSDVGADQLIDLPPTVNESAGNTTPVVTPPSPNVTVDPPDNQSQESPREVTVIEDPKYILNKHFTWEVTLSNSPHHNVPYKGAGIPYINVHYQSHDLNGAPLNDTSMLHNGYVAPQGGYGFDLCNSITRFWKWSAVYVDVEGINRTLSYASHPLPDNYYNLLGGGENCYLRAHLEGTLYTYVCMEGDGSLSPYYTEEVNGIVYHYYDYMDYCISAIHYT